MSDKKTLRELKSLHEDVLRIIHEADDAEAAPVPSSRIQSRLESIERTGRDNLLQVVKYYLYEGREIFDMENALVAAFRGDNYVVTAAVTDLPVVENMIFKICDTYCSEIYTSGNTYTIQDVASTAGGLSHPVYQNLKLRAYIGAPIFIGERLYGSVSFSSQSPRTDFLGYEKRAVEFLARLIGSCLSDGETQ